MWEVELKGERASMQGVNDPKNRMMCRYFVFGVRGRRWVAYKYSDTQREGYAPHPLTPMPFLSTKVPVWSYLVFHRVLRGYRSLVFPNPKALTVPIYRFPSLPLPLPKQNPLGSVLTCPPDPSPFRAQLIQHPGLHVLTSLHVFYHHKTTTLWQQHASQTLRASSTQIREPYYPCHMPSFTYHPWTPITIIVYVLPTVAFIFHSITKCTICYFLNSLLTHFFLLFLNKSSK